LSKNIINKQCQGIVSSDGKQYQGLSEQYQKKRQHNDPKYYQVIDIVMKQT